MTKKLPNFTPECVYTILHSRDLATHFKAGRRGQFDEGKKWATAYRMLQAARKAGQIVPLIFARGENISDLPFYAHLEDLKIGERDGKPVTTVIFSHLTRIGPPLRNKTQLKVVSTGQRLPASHIRPYVIVHTPGWLR